MRGLEGQHRQATVRKLGEEPVRTFYRIELRNRSIVRKTKREKKTVTAGVEGGVEFELQLDE